jgi:glycerol-3-phosphate dehydrogenase (NAD(P)+)
MDGSVAVVGAGSWGTTIAALLAQRTPTALWCRSAELAARITSGHENPTYLPGIRVPDGLRVTADLEIAVGTAELVLMAVPSHGFRSVFERVAPFLDTRAAVVSLTKGIERTTDLRMSQVVTDVLPSACVGVLTGPNLARELAEGQPGASVVAFDDMSVATRAQLLLHFGRFRVYTTTDVIGCEIAGAVKNVMAIAAGISDGLGFGGNTRAALITRGLAEITRFGMAAGGRSPTFGGLAGIGDLVATCTSPKSRNWTVGYQLGQGRPLPEIVASTQMVAEGIQTAAPIVELAASYGVEMPIAAQIAALAAEATSPRAALAALLDRPAREEVDNVGYAADAS